PVGAVAAQDGDTIAFSHAESIAQHGGSGGDGAGVLDEAQPRLACRGDEARVLGVAPPPPGGQQIAPRSRAVPENTHPPPKHERPLAGEQPAGREQVALHARHRFRNGRFHGRERAYWPFFIWATASSCACFISSGVRSLTCWAISHSIPQRSTTLL